MKLCTTILLLMIAEGVAAKKCKKSHVNKFETCLENGFRSSIEGCENENGDMAKQEKKKCKKIEKKMKKCNHECSELTDRCPEEAPLVNCFMDPCSTAECANYPDASCTPNYCGGCNAEFYDERRNLITDCGEEEESGAETSVETSIETSVETSDETSDEGRSRKNNAGVTVKIDRQKVSLSALPTRETMSTVYAAVGQGLEYIQGSRTHDNLRYEKQNGELPFIFTFTDYYNHHYEIKMKREDASLTMVFPCGATMMWYGADASPTRTGSDAQAHFCEVNFSYISGDWFNANGVRISFIAMRKIGSTEWKGNNENWEDILDLTKEGISAASAATKLAANMAALG